MTNEEAIKELQSMCDHLHAHGICDKDSNMLTACKMAISALEQKPTVDEMEREYEKSKALFNKIVESEDAVSREAVDGHWIIIDDCEKFIAKCSECGRIEDSRMISKYPYCHCGAKMQESEKV
jgi:hypothetical protein